MLSDTDIRTLERAQHILNEYNCAIRNAESYMEGWRTGRAEAYAHEAATNIRPVLRNERRLRAQSAQAERDTPTSA